MKNDLLNGQIILRGDTAKAMLAGTELGNQVDLQALAAKAKQAMQISKTSIARAAELNDSWWDRLFSSGELQEMTLQAIGSIGQISEVNVALAAICNDLAVDNLRRAERIDLAQRETSQQMARVECFVATIEGHLSREHQRSISLDRKILDEIAPELADLAKLQDRLEGLLEEASAEQRKFETRVNHELMRLGGERAKLQENVNFQGAQLQRNAKYMGELRRQLDAYSNNQAQLKNQLDVQGGKIVEQMEILNSVTRNLEIFKQDVNNNFGELQRAQVSANSRFMDWTSEVDERLTYLRKSTNRKLALICLAFIAAQVVVVWFAKYSSF